MWPHTSLLLVAIFALLFHCSTSLFHFIIVSNECSKVHCSTLFPMIVLVLFLEVPIFSVSFIVNASKYTSVCLRASFRTSFCICIPYFIHSYFVLITFCHCFTEVFVVLFLGKGVKIFVEYIAVHLFLPVSVQVAFWYFSSVHKFIMVLHLPTCFEIKILWLKLGIWHSWNWKHTDECYGKIICIYSWHCCYQI